MACAPDYADSGYRILTLCTGNVARSVMLGFMLGTLGEENGLDWKIRTAGTHVSEGAAMSSRTKDALVHLDIGEHRYGTHRSHQITDEDASWAEVILCSEAAHVYFVREHFRDASTKTVLLAQFLSDEVTSPSFRESVQAVAARTPSGFFDVDDPAGGDQSAYDKCAEQLWKLAREFLRAATRDQ